MYKQKISLSILTSGLIGVFFTFTSPVQAQSVLFECAVDSQNVPTTYAQAGDKTVQIFKWTSTFFNPPYTPLQRCQEVAQRLNNFKPDHLVAGRVNNYNVICAGTSCNRSGSNILLTLRPDQNPAQVLAEIDNTRDGAGGPSMQLGEGSGGQNQSQTKSNLITTQDGSVALNLKAYIQSAPAIPLNLGNNTSNGFNNNTQLNQQPITAPSDTGKPPSSSRGSAW
jgi:hypothetical protein